MFKSYNFWVSLSGALGLLAVAIGKAFNVQIQAEGVEEIVMTLCGVLVVLGIVTKPKKDDSVEKDDRSDNNSKNVH